MNIIYIPKVITSFLFLIICYTLNGQNCLQNINLFEEFINGKVLMKNKSVIQAPLNYDCVNREMNYLNNGERMILEGLNTIDTIFIAGRKFIPMQNIFLEVISMTNSNQLLIDWRTKVINRGKKGAMGSVSHTGTVEKMDIKRAQGKGFDNTDNYIYETTSDNTYYIQIDNSLKKFNSEKTFLKLLSQEKTEAIKSYLKKQNTNFKNVSDVIKLINLYFEL